MGRSGEVGLTVGLGDLHGGIERGEFKGVGRKSIICSLEERIRWAVAVVCLYGCAMAGRRRGC